MGIMDLAAQALTEVDSISAAEAVERFGDDALVFVDVRDIREVEQSDTIEGSHHAPRGHHQRGPALGRHAGLARGRRCNHATDTPMSA